jgi:hypothetical protein
MRGADWFGIATHLSPGSGGTPGPGERWAIQVRYLRTRKTKKDEGPGMRLNVSGIHDHKIPPRNHLFCNTRALPVPYTPISAPQLLSIFPIPPAFVPRRGGPMNSPLWKPGRRLHLADWNYGYACKFRQPPRLLSPGWGDTKKDGGKTLRPICNQMSR